MAFHFHLSNSYNFCFLTLIGIFLVLDHSPVAMNDLNVLKHLIILLYILKISAEQKITGILRSNILHNFVQFTLTNKEPKYILKIIYRAGDTA